MTKRVEILKGEKVSLVVPEKQDVEVWYRGLNDIEIQSYLGSIFGTIITKEAEEEFYNNLNKDKKNLVFAIYINKEDKIIGNIGISSINYVDSHAELGVAIFDKENQGKGYGTEALELVLKYVFEVLGLNKFHLKYLSTNTRAGRVYEKCGFKEVGIQKQHKYIFGEYRDDVIMEIMKEDYFKNK